MDVGAIPGMSDNLNVVETYTVQVLRPGHVPEFITNASGGRTLQLGLKFNF